MTIYFTGTGNRRYIAKTLSKKSKDELKDRTKPIKKRKNPKLHNAVNTEQFVMAYGVEQDRLRAIFPIIPYKFVKEDFAEKSDSAVARR